MRSLRNGAVIGFVVGVAVNAFAGQVCQSGSCYSDPSLTSDTVHAASASSGTATAADTSSTSSDTSGSTTSLSADSLAKAQASAASISGSLCVSIYPDYPLTSAQTTLCQNAVTRLTEAEQARLQAAADKKNEELKAAQQQQQQQPQQQQPSSGSPQQSKDDGGDKDKSSDQAKSADSDKDKGGGDECESALKKYVDKCEKERAQSAYQCSNDSDEGKAANSGIDDTASGIGKSQTNANFQTTSNGNAQLGRNLRNFSGACRPVAESCQKDCSKKLTKAAQDESMKSCKKSEDKSKIEKAVATLQKKASSCERDSDKADDADEQAAAADGTSKEAGKNQAGSAGDMSGLASALKGLSDKAKAADASQVAVGTVDPSVIQSQICSTEASSIDQVCRCRLNSIATAAQCKGSSVSGASPIATTSTSTTTASPISVGDYALPSSVRAPASESVQLEGVTPP